MEKIKNSKTRINPSSLQGSSPVAPCWRASKASTEKKVSNLQVIQRWGKTSIHSRASFCQRTSPPCTVLYSTMVTPRYVRGSELVLVLNLVRQCATDVHHSSYYSWMNRSESPPSYIDLHCAAHYINCQSPKLTPPTLHIQPPSLPTQQQLSRFNTHWHCADWPPWILGDYYQALTSVDLFLAHNTPDAHLHIMDSE